MLDVETMRQLVMDAVPFNRVLGVRVEAVEPERVSVSLPESPDRLNHVGTVHAAAQFGLGEATAGVMVIAAFNDLQAAGYAPLAVSAQIAYRKPARGDLRGEATLSAEEQARVRNAIAGGERPRFTVPVRLFDREGVMTTEMSVEWALLAPKG